MIDYGLVISTVYPGVEHSVFADGTIVHWGSELSEPTVAEMDALWPRVEALAYNGEQERHRYDDYQREADPLFMKWQAGESTEAEWLAKRAEIKARYPYVEVPE
jgi:hypothetical protein